MRRSEVSSEWRIFRGGLGFVVLCLHFFLMGGVIGRLD